MTDTPACVLVAFPVRCSRMGPRLSPFGYGPFAEPETPTALPAIQRASYTMDDPQGSTVVIHKHVELKTLDNVGDAPRIELTANGETVFDLKAGVPQKITLAGTLTIREDSGAQIPVSLTCERVAASTVPASKVPAPSQVVASAPPAAVPLVPVESDTARLERFLADLRAEERDWGKCFEALQGLTIMPPVEARRDEVSVLLDRYLKEKNYSARSSALRAAKVWGTKRNVPALITLLSAAETDSVRQNAMECLGRLGDPRAAGPLAEMLKSPSDRARAGASASLLGPRGRKRRDRALSL